MLGELSNRILALIADCEGNGVHKSTLYENIGGMPILIDNQVLSLGEAGYVESYYSSDMLPFIYLTGKGIQYVAEMLLPTLQKKQNEN